MGAVDHAHPMPDDEFAQKSKDDAGRAASTVDQPDAPVLSLDGARKRREEAIAQKAREIVQDLTLTGSYLRFSLERAEYFARLDEIADAPDEQEIPSPNEGISEYEKDLLIAISVARMNQTDATDDQKNGQEAHIREVGEKATAAAKADPNPVDLALVQTQAYLHDCDKFCPMMRKGAAGVEVMLSNGKSVSSYEEARGQSTTIKTNSNLIGHNADSALTAILILGRLHPTMPRSRVLRVGKGILTHSDDEFPDELGLIRGELVERRNGYEVYFVFGSLYVRSRMDRTILKSLEANILRSNDMIVGVWVGSYIKYLEQHVNNPTLVDEDTETMEDREWTRLQAAVQTCFETSANNYFKAPHAITRELFGKELLAGAQAYREWFRRFTSVQKKQGGEFEYSTDLLQRPDAEEIKAAMETINAAVNYEEGRDRAPIVDAYKLLLKKAEEYTQQIKSQMEAKQSGSFTQKYYKEFLDEHGVLLEDEQQYWSTKFDPKKVPPTTAPEKVEQEQVVRQRKKDWKLKNTARLQQAIEKEIKKEV